MECLRAANGVRGLTERLNLLKIAQLFMRLAEHTTDRLVRGTRDRPAEYQPDRGIHDV
jgi:hypothetical protein